MAKKRVKMRDRDEPGMLVVDPRRDRFLGFFLDPNSATFGDAMNSAIKAGFGRKYAENITSRMPGWLEDQVGRVGMFRKAERNLREFLEMDVKNAVSSKDGEVYEVDDVGKLRVKQDTSKFVAERLGRKYYGQRLEVGGVIGHVHVELDDGKFREIARREAGVPATGGEE